MKLLSDSKPVFFKIVVAFSVLKPLVVSAPG
jgi:hypothetical protein